jgi:hypothetical protein
MSDNKSVFDHVCHSLADNGMVLQPGVAPVVHIPAPQPTDAALAQLLADRLTEICQTEPEAVSALVAHRVRCGPALAGHPTVQIDGDKAGGWVGLVGILNGLCGSTLPGGWPRIVAELTQDDDGSVHCIGFSANKPPR